MPTRTLRYEYQKGGGNTIAREVEKSASGSIEIEETIADSSTDEEIAFALDVSACEMFFIVSSRDVTVETNDGSSADDTLALKAGEPYVWHSTSLDSFLLTQDVTSLFVTNASGSSATIIVEALYDPTP